MNLLDQMKAIDIGKIADEEVAESIQKAIANYDERVPKTLTVAEMILEMVRDNFPSSIKMDKVDISEEAEYIEPEEAEIEVKKGKSVMAETAGGDTYSVMNKKEIREAVKKDHELKVVEPEEEPIRKKQERFFGKNETVLRFDQDSLEQDEEEVDKLFKKLKCSSEKPIIRRFVKRKDGSKFYRSYVSNYDAKVAFERKLPLYADTMFDTIYSIRTPAMFIKSLDSGYNHFTLDDSHIEEVPEIEEEANEPEIKSGKKKITPENKGDCEIIISEIQDILSKYQSKKPKNPKEKPKKKPLAVLVKDSMVSIIKKVIVKEKARSKKDIDPKRFDPVIAKGKDFLKALRKASGGISDNNDQMIDSFESQMNEILETLKK